jgi:hypothetical protein
VYSQIATVGPSPIRERGRRHTNVGSIPEIVCSIMISRLGPQADAPLPHVARNSVEGLDDLRSPVTQIDLREIRADWRGRLLYRQVKAKSDFSRGHVAVPNRP